MYPNPNIDNLKFTTQNNSLLNFEEIENKTKISGLQGNLTQNNLIQSKYTTSQKEENSLKGSAFRATQKNSIMLELSKVNFGKSNVFEIHDILITEDNEENSKKHTVNSFEVVGSKDGESLSFGNNSFSKKTSAQQATTIQKEKEEIHTNALMRNTDITKMQLAFQRTAVKREINTPEIISGSDTLINSNRNSTSSKNPLRLQAFRDNNLSERDENVLKIELEENCRKIFGWKTQKESKTQFQLF